MTMANRVTFSSNNNGSGNGWHKDAYRKQFKSILYLNNVDNNNGPFQLLKKSNKILNLIKVAIKLQKLILIQDLAKMKLKKYQDLKM